MSQFYTKLSSPPKSTPKLKPNPSAPSSRRTRRSSPRMDWIQIMIRSTCASCSGWEMDEKRGSLCISGSRRSSRSLDSRSSSCRTKWGYRTLQQTLPEISELAMTAISGCEVPSDLNEGQGEIPLLLCMMQRTKALDKSGREQILCRDSRPSNRLYWTVDRRRELLREGRKRQLRTPWPQELQEARLGGVG